MTDRSMPQGAATLILGVALALGAGNGLAFDMGNMMNPSKWMGGGKDRDYDDGPWGGPGYGGPGYGYGGPGYGYGGPGYGGGYGYGGPGEYGGPGGYGAPGPGFGAPGGYGPAGPAYGGAAYGAADRAYPAPAPSAPAAPASPYYGAPPSGADVYGAPPAAGTDAEIEALKSRLRALEGSGVR
ncbi:MAG: hypothetical protein MUC77_10575 [Chromatiaceae bacterium]|jgi:hypothetical protein|nr:hypothetical protein [Chromatiaceae bacterium]